MYGNKLKLYPAWKPITSIWAQFSWFFHSPKMYCLVWKSTCFFFFGIFLFTQDCKLISNIICLYHLFLFVIMFVIAQRFDHAWEPLFSFNNFYFIILFRGLIEGSTNILLTINLMWFKPLFEYFLSNKTQSFQYKNKVVWRNIHEMSIKLSLFLYLFLKIITNIYQKSQDYIWLLKYSSK